MTNRRVVRAGTVVAGLVCVALGVGSFLRRPASDLATLLCETTWVAYAPTNFDPNGSPPRLPDEASLRADLTVLRRAGFDGLITYGADIGPITKIAGEVGFDRLILGIWNPSSQAEQATIIREAASDRVIGVIVGNETLTFRRSDVPTLAAAMASVRRATGKPVSSTEVIEAFFTNRDLVEASDFLTVNAHPYFHALRDPVKAAEWTIAAYDNLAARVRQRPILLKEIGMPTLGDEGLSEANQARYFTLMSQSHVNFAYFEAYDALFKRGPLEQSWGLFRADRSPKPAGSAIRSHHRTRRCSQ